MPKIIEINVQTGERVEREMTAEELASIPVETKAKKMKKAAISYNEDLDGLQEQYLAALFSNEEETAAELQAEAATRKAEYQAELAQIRSE